VAQVCDQSLLGHALEGCSAAANGVDAALKNAARAWVGSRESEKERALARDQEMLQDRQAAAAAHDAVRAREWAGAGLLDGLEARVGELDDILCMAAVSGDIGSNSSPPPSPSQPPPPIRSVLLTLLPVGWSLAQHVWVRFQSQVRR